MNKNNMIKLSITLLIIGLLTVGGTYAWLSYGFNVTNGNLSITSTCFSIDYGTENGDGTVDIFGTLFQSADPLGGLDGRVSININNDCANIVGKANLFLTLPNTIDPVLVQTVDAHCENISNLQTMDLTEASCSSDNSNVWVTAGSALKYAISTNSSFTNIISKGYITADMIGGKSIIWDGTDIGGNDVIIDNTVKYFYISVWLDGYLTDNAYTEIPFTGYATVSVTQLQ